VYQFVPLNILNKLLQEQEEVIKDLRREGYVKKIEEVHRTMLFDEEKKMEPRVSLNIFVEEVNDLLIGAELQMHRDKHDIVLKMRTEIYIEKK
jgi:hypothetical protein